MRTRLLANLGLLAALCLGLLSPATAEVVLGSQDTFYPRLIRLAANGTANGRLIASFDIAGTKGLINESVDGGLTWAEVGNVNTGADPAHCCSTLYEVPQTLGTTAQGTLLWATTTINGSAYNIRIHKSIDKGRSWSFLATAVSGATGVWEPEFSINSSGQLVMFYSSEEYKGSGYNQLIAHRVSSDGGVSWGPDVIDVGVSDGNQLRPGMPVVRRLPNASYVMSYEVCGPRNCDVYLRTSTNGTAWGTASNLGTRIESTSGNHFSHAPTIAWMNDGSANGRLIVVGQVLNRNSGNAVVSDVNGRVFMFNTGNGTGLWTEAAMPLRAASDGTEACNNYSTQLLPSTNGAQLLEMVNIGCRIHLASGPTDNPLAAGVYTVVSKNSGLLLDVNACATAAGANVQQWQATGANCQRWSLSNAGNGDYTITSVNSGLVLDVNACSTVNGGNVQQWTSNGASCQKWRLEPVGEGYFRVISKNSGLVLDVNACSTVNGGNVQQWAWLGGDCQRWKFVPLP